MKRAAPKRCVIIGAGISGLAAARAMSRFSPGTELIVLERSARLGGLIETEMTPEGFVLEHGPDSLGITQPSTTALLHVLHLDDFDDANKQGVFVHAHESMQLARDHDFVRLSGAALDLLNLSPGALLASSRLSWFEKIRWVSRGLSTRPRDAISFGEFIEQRFGNSNLKEHVTHLLRGVCWVDINAFDVSAVLASIERRVDRAAHVVFASGMHMLPLSIARELPASIYLNTGVTKITQTLADKFNIHVANGARLSADALIIATPALVAARLTESLDTALASALGTIQTVDSWVVNLAWRRQDVGSRLDGTGFFVPSSQGCATLACRWLQRDDAMNEHVMFRVFMGGKMMGSCASLKEAIDVAKRELRTWIDFRGEPQFVRGRFRPRALPVYAQGHLGRLQLLNACMKAHGRVALAGNAYHGMSVEECILSGQRAARAVMQAPG